MATIDNFKINDMVWHITNSQQKMIVKGLDGGVVYCEWMSKNGDFKNHKFSPEDLTSQILEITAAAEAERVKWEPMGNN